MKRLLFVLYTLIILSVSFSCIHKEQSSELTEAESPIVEKEVQVTNFFGIPLLGKDVASIVKMMEEKVDVFSLDGNLDEERDYCKVLFCGVPCGMNIQWKEKDGMVYIYSLNIMTSQKSKEAIAALAKGISSYYGECHQDEQDEMDDYFRWEEVLLRPVHSEEGGMAVIFY
ncbi:MAG: hypothetical protein IJR02_01375 [Bacteroidaceae bacterium]|nr:hypothetical protein [Bacteroidaceae bacterium]